MKEKILKLLEHLYNLDENEKEKFSREIDAMDDNSKESFALALLQRYNESVKNFKELNLKLSFIENDIWDIKDKLEADKIEF